MSQTPSSYDPDPARDLPPANLNPDDGLQQPAEYYRVESPRGEFDAAGDTGGDRGTSDVAKEQASELKDSAQEAGQRVAGVAKDQAASVASEATTQAKDLLKQGRDELSDQTAQQQARVASGLHSLSHRLTSMASGSNEQGLAADLAREAAQRTDALASWLDGREPGQLLEEVRSFARERPGAFLGIAAAAGVLAGRLGRGLNEGPPATATNAEAPTEKGATVDLSTGLGATRRAPREPVGEYPS
jgi:hypothetical protein